MKTNLLIGLSLASLGANVNAADKAQCDAKPFTLNKPDQPQAKPAAPAASKPAAAPRKLAAAKPKPKPVADCDKPASKPR